METRTNNQKQSNARRSLFDQYLLSVACSTIGVSSGELYATVCLRDGCDLLDHEAVLNAMKQLGLVDVSSHFLTWKDNEALRTSLRSIVKEATEVARFINGEED